MTFWLLVIALGVLDHVLAWRGRVWARRLVEARHGDLPPLWEVRVWRLNLYKRIALADLYPPKRRVRPIHLRQDGVDP